MNGVEILAVEQVVVGWKYNFEVFRVSLGVVLILVILFAILFAIIYDEISAFFAALIFGAIIAGCIAGFIGLAEKEPTEYVYEYMVVVSESVSLSEFSEQYEIIDQQGKIYTVRERETNNG